MYANDDEQELESAVVFRYTVMEMNIKVSIDCIVVWVFTVLLYNDKLD